MGYFPTESPNGSWRGRNRSWRNRTPEQRERITDMPVRFRRLDVTKLPKTPAGKLVEKWCSRWHAYPNSGIPTDFDATDFRGTGLLFTGDPGTGKTTLACIAAQYVSDLGWSTKFIRAQDYYALAIRAMQIKDEQEREAWQSLIDCYDAGWDGWKLVVIDDLGQEHNTLGGTFSENLIESVIRARFDDGAPTIVTTNLSPEGIGERYGPALADYIREAFWIVKVAGESRRGR